MNVSYIHINQENLYFVIKQSGAEISDDAGFSELMICELIGQLKHTRGLITT